MSRSLGPPRRHNGKKRGLSTGVKGPRRSGGPPSIEGIADAVVRGADELLRVEDPLEAEAWASQVLGTFYKVNVPWEARELLERGVPQAIVAKAEQRADAAGLAALEALAAVGEDDLAGIARPAADRLRARGITAPAWVPELRSVVFEDAWMMLDVYGDHEAYFATYRYPGRKPHVVNALYDKAMGEIIKDGFVGYAPSDARARVDRQDGVAAVDCEPGAMARRVIDAIANGDLYLDNDWTPEFKRFRALILSRMRLLPKGRPPKTPRPPTQRQRKQIVTEFLSSQSGAAALDEADAIAELCLDYSCDYLGEEPFRWSPIVVEQFMLDYLPRKVSLSMAQVRQLPAVLREWVSFALTKRGLEERWITETEAAVDRWSRDFRRAVTDTEQFGLAKRLGNALLADGVDALDQASVQRWIDDFNARPQTERDSLLGKPPT
ncbi:MAG: hypothetical protein WD830_12315 [Chloroflexota bacterium]